MKKESKGERNAVSSESQPEEEHDIYGREERLADEFRKLDEADIHPRNKKLIEDFVSHKVLAEGTKEQTQVRHYIKMRMLAHLVDKPFDEMTRDDVEMLVVKMNRKTIKWGATEKRMTHNKLKHFYFIHDEFNIDVDEQIRHDRLVCAIAGI